MSAAETSIVEVRLRRIKAILVALPCVALKGDDCGGMADISAELGAMAAEEMAKVEAVLGAEVLNRDS